jgi:hypothetical protein
LKKSFDWKRRKQEQSRKGGLRKKSLYDPNLGSGNWRKAEDGRYADHPAFRACRALQGAFQGAYITIGCMVEDFPRLRRSRKIEQIAARLTAAEIQASEALCTLRDEARKLLGWDERGKLKGPGEKFRFADALTVSFNRLNVTRNVSHPVFHACRRLEDAFVEMGAVAEDFPSIVRDKRTQAMARRLRAAARQASSASSILSQQALGLYSKGDKLRFAEAFATALNRTMPRDEKIFDLCWKEIEMRTDRSWEEIEMRVHRQSPPSQAQLRRKVENERGRKPFLPKDWKRLMRRTGLNKKLPTHREKRLQLHSAKA